MTNEVMISADDANVSYAQATQIYIGMCDECTFPSRVELGDADTKTALAACLHCEAPITVERLWAIVSQGSCDWRCMGAVGSECNCMCGGVNHAGDWRFNRHTSEQTESAVQRLIAQRQRTAERREAREIKKAVDAAEQFEQWLSSLWGAELAAVEWIRDYDNVKDESDFLVEMRLRMMPNPSNPVKYPALPLTSPQLDAVVRSVAAIIAKRERRADEIANAKPVPEGRHSVRGEIISRRYEESEDPFIPPKYKILMKCDGFKLWGTCPRDLLNDVWPSRDSKMPEGLIIQMNATITPRDTAFGIFKNPRSARIVDEPMIPGLDVSLRQAEEYRQSVPSVKQSAPTPAPRVSTSVDAQDTSEKLSAPRKSGSHADCEHEATKSARAKCRRERNSK